MVFWPWSKDNLLKNELNLIKNRLEVMAKTIRSHPTSPFILPEPIFWTTLIFSNFGLEMDLHFLHLSNLPTSKKTTPQRKKDAHGPSLHFRFLSTCHFWYGIYYHFLTLLVKTYFLELLSDFNSFVYLRFKNRRPQIIIISK